MALTDRIPAALPRALRGSPYTMHINGRLAVTPLNSLWRLIPSANGVDPLRREDTRAKSSLWCSRVSIQSRSLPPDDPFGERSSWEDPSTSMFAAWKDVDQEAFITAADSREVREAHFGPEWARLATVGRMSVKMVRDGQEVQHGSFAVGPPPSDGSLRSHTSPTMSPSLAADETSATPVSRRYPTAEELHDAALQQRQHIMERNYTSYEEFVEHEFGADGMGTDIAELTSGTGGQNNVQDVPATDRLHFTASMENAFFATEGVEGRDRMAQRNLEREALGSVEAVEVEERVPLPPFMMEIEAASVQGGATTASRSCGASSPADFPSGLPVTRGPPQSQRPTPSSSPAVEVCGSGDTLPATPSDKHGIPRPVVQQVLDALGSPHGDPRLPLVDPALWDTEDVILFLKLMEQPPSAGVSSDSKDTSPSWSTMDDSMCDTFRLGRVTGDTLLHVVTPPRLFRVLRRWHVLRQRAIQRAWEGSIHTQTGMTVQRSATKLLPADVVNRAAVEVQERLDDAVRPVGQTLIQETILMCFPYGH